MKPFNDNIWTTVYPERSFQRSCAHFRIISIKTYNLWYSYRVQMVVQYIVCPKAELLILGMVFCIICNSKQYYMWEANILVCRLRRKFPVWVVLFVSIFKCQQKGNFRFRRDVIITVINKPIETRGNMYVSIPPVFVYVIIKNLCLTSVKLWRWTWWYVNCVTIITCPLQYQTCLHTINTLTCFVL